MCSFAVQENGRQGLGMGAGVMQTEWHRTKQVSLSHRMGSRILQSIKCMYQKQHLKRSRRVTLFPFGLYCWVILGPEDVQLASPTCTW